MKLTPLQGIISTGMGRIAAEQSPYPQLTTLSCIHHTMPRGKCLARMTGPAQTVIASTDWFHSSLAITQERSLIVTEHRWLLLPEKEKLNASRFADNIDR